jgi:xanthine dehydrogenase accessory factor
MWDWVSKLAELSRDGTPLAMATVVDARGSTPREAGARLLVLEDGRFFGTVGGGHLELRVLEDARAALATGQTRTHRYPLGAALGQCCGGTVDVFIEVLNTGPRLYLFGGGHVGQALCGVLQGTPFRVELVDERPEWLHAPALPASVGRHGDGWDVFCDGARWSAASTYVVVMTHRHDVDQDIVEHVVGRPARFIGLIGSRAKWARFRQRLAARGVDAARLDRVQCPVGVPAGKAPQEVAISIAAGLLQAHHARQEVGAPAAAAGEAVGTAEAGGPRPAPRALPR